MRSLTIVFSLFLAFTFVVIAQNKEDMSKSSKQVQSAQIEKDSLAKDTAKAIVKSTEVKKNIIGTWWDSVKINFYNAFIVTCKGMAGVLIFMFIFYLITQLLTKIFPQTSEKK